MNINRNVKRTMAVTMLAAGVTLMSTNVSASAAKKPQL